MQTSRSAGSASSDKASELSAPSLACSSTRKPTSPAVTIAAVAKFHRAVHGFSGHATATTNASPSPAEEQDPQALLKSFRRNKCARARLLMPLAGDAEPSPRTRRVASPRKAHISSPSRIASPLAVDKQSLLARLAPYEDRDRDEPNNRHEDQEEQIVTLARVHALLASPDEIHRWIATYETEKTQFTSFALFTEMKLDEIYGRYVAQAARPNAVEAAACCATLLKMPGLVACYRTLLEKLAVGLVSVVYLPIEEDAEVNAHPSLRDDTPSSSMATLVRGFFARKPYFQRVQELERQVGNARSLTDPSVLASLTTDEIKTMVRQIPVRIMSEGIVEAYALHVPHLDHLCTLIQDKKMQVQLDFYQLHGRRRRMATRRSTSQHNSTSADDEEDFEDHEYPVAIPLTSSAQICRAIMQHATTFSASGKEMILCSMLEHIDVESFKDVFKRFDAHGKTCFLHHLSVLESSDHLQLILEALPNPGEMLFRFYYAICGGGGSVPGRSDDPKHVFFHKVLSADMEFFFLCDLAAYLNDEQWTLLSQEYEKHAQARKARRLRLRRRLPAGGDGKDAENQEDRKDGDGEEEEEEEEIVDAAAKKMVSSGSLEQLQTVIGNYLRRHKLTSIDIWGLLQVVLIPSLDETEIIACIDFCMDRLSLPSRWKKLLAMVEAIVKTDDTTSENDGALEMIHRVRLKILKTLVVMLSKEDCAWWLEKTALKHGLLLTAKPHPDPVRKDPVVAPTPIVQPAPPPKPLNLDDPKSYIVQMRLDTKMLWLEALLNAVANDKETSARTAMLKQTLLPFLNGRVPVAVVQSPVPSTPPQDNAPLTLADAEKAIASILYQLKLKNPAEEAALWHKILPDHLRAKAVATCERAVSPIPALSLVVTTTPSSPGPFQAVVPPRGWWEASGPDSAVARAFRNLLETTSEADLLALLSGREIRDPDADQLAIVKPDSAGGKLSRVMKRKMSAVVAVSEPMAWQSFVKVGMLDQGTQTESSLSIDTPVDKPTATTTTVIRAPLTLTTLLGRLPNDRAGASSTLTPSPRRKGDAKFQKLNTTAVPRSIASLITSWRVNTDQLTQFAKKSLATVLRLIADAYSELLTAGRRKANTQATNVRSSGATNTKELTLAQIVYQQFLHSYGLPGIADMHLLALSCALEIYRAQHWRVEFFARFVFEEAAKLELANYLEFLECLVCDDPGAGSTTTTSSTTSSGPVTTKRQRFVPRIVVPDKEQWLVPVEKAQEAAQLCFRAMRKQAVTAFCDKLAVIASQGTGSSMPDGVNIPSQADAGRASPSVSTQVASSPPSTDGLLLLNVDLLLKLVLDEWRDEQRRREVHLLNAFRAGDVNGDGELTSAEFTQIVLAIDPTRDLGDILLMYSETLQRTQSHAIDADHFLAVAKEYDLDRAAWHQDGELRNIVNDTHELTRTWHHTKPFFLGTLEALARDLPTQHFLRVCEGAGCGCLKCILDGYIGFQRMRREFDSTASSTLRSVGGTHGVTHGAVSEALLWARFWHLMRQLYEAASESPGVLTAWDGADNYMRVHAAPRPLPRFLKYRRMAVPHFLFPDTARISAKMSSVHDVQAVAEAFDRDAIVAQFAKLMALMRYATPSNTSGNPKAAMAIASADDAVTGQEVGS